MIVPLTGIEMSETGIIPKSTDYTDWPADVCKYSQVFEDVLVVGTYMLDESTKLRHGKLVLYDTKEDVLYVRSKNS